MTNETLSHAQRPPRPWRWMWPLGCYSGSTALLTDMYWHAGCWWLAEEGTGIAFPLLLGLWVTGGLAAWLLIQLA